MFILFSSLSLSYALSINNTIPSEINQYEFDINSFASCNDFDNCNITFSRDDTTIDLPYSINQNLSYTGNSFGAGIASLRGITSTDNYFYIVTGGEIVRQYDLDGTYTGTSFSTSGQMSSAEDIAFNGTHLFVLASNPDTVFVYTESGTYTGTSYSVAGEDTTPRGLTYYDNNFYMSGDATDTVYEYDNTFSTTGFTFSTSSQETQPWGIEKDGDYFYLTGNTDFIYQYNNTGSYTGLSLNIASQTTEPQGIALSGTNLFVLGTSNNNVYNYTAPANMNLTYTFTYNGNQDYTIFASNSTNTINESGSLLVNPPVSFNFQENSTNVENYSFGSREDLNGFVTYNIYNDGLTLGENSLTFDKFGYILQNFNFTLTNTTNQNFTYNVSPAQINVNIYDRITENLITQNVDLQLIGNVGDTVSTSTGTAQLNAIDGVAGDYQVIATSSGYETESVYFEYTNQENVSLNVYLINSTDLSLGFVTIEVKDTLSFFIEGAIVNLLEWKPSISSFVTVGQCQTLSNGKCNLNIELNNKLYKFQANKDETTAETTSIIIDETGQTIPVTLQDIVLTAVPNSDNILSNMSESIDNSTNSSLIRLQWSTKDNTNAQACIKVFSNPGYSQQLIAFNCTTSNSGVLFMNVDINNPQTVKVEGTVQDSFNIYLIDVFTYEGTGSLSKALSDYNLDILIPIIFFFIGLSIGLLFGNIYIGIIIGVILEWIATIIAGNVMSVGVAVVITFISGLIIWGAYKK